jgi:hypothetical protein
VPSAGEDSVDGFKVELPGARSVTQQFTCLVRRDRRPMWAGMSGHFVQALVVTAREVGQRRRLYQDALGEVRMQSDALVDMPSGLATTARLDGPKVRVNRNIFKDCWSESP